MSDGGGKKHWVHALIAALAGAGAGIAHAGTDHPKRTMPVAPKQNDHLYQKLRKKREEDRKNGATPKQEK